MNFLIKEKNIHLSHLEDLIFKGETEQVFYFFHILLDYISGSSNSLININIKWDGSPSIIAGIDPSDGKFFVGTKSVFNKTPKLVKTEEDAKILFNGDLQEKILTAFTLLKDLITEGVYQGDIMFTTSTLNTEVIDGQKYYTFQPNTIVYAIPINSEIGLEIKESKIGIVWHTTYSGNSLQNMVASFNKSIIEKMGKNSLVWMKDVSFIEWINDEPFLKSEINLIKNSLKSLNELYKKIDNNLFDEFKNDKELQKRLNTFNNSFIRNGEIINPKEHTRKFMEYLHNYYENEKEKRKTEKGKLDQLNRRDNMMRIFSEYRIIDFYNIFFLFKKISDLKKIYIEKLNDVKGFKTFLKTEKGLQDTNQEGFVVVDHLNNAVKLVNRIEFSYANTSNEYLKGWITR